MKTKLNIATYLLYTAAFSGFMAELLGIEKSIGTLLLLLLDVGLLYLGIGAIAKNKLNLVVFIAILLLSSLCYAAHDYALVTHINGLREILNMVLVFSFFESLEDNWKAAYYARFRKFTGIFLISQIPVTLYQFAIYGAGDHVGGSLGGGNSGVLTLVIILMVYWRIRERLPLIGGKAYFNALYLAPLVLNETKISFLLIPVLFFCLIKKWTFKHLIINALGGILFFFLLNSLYTDQGQSKEDPFAEMFDAEFLDYYLLGSNSDTEYDDIPRVLKIVLAVDLLQQHGEDAMFGMSYGVFKGGSMVEKDAFANEYNWLLSGSRPTIFYLLISGGFSLLVLVITYFLTKIYGDGRGVADTGMMLLLTVLLCIMMVYNDAIRGQFFLMIYAFFILEAKGFFRTAKVPRKTIVTGLPAGFIRITN